MPSIKSILLTALLMIVWSQSLVAQDPYSPRRRNAAFEAYRDAEATRQAAVAEQLYQNNLQRAMAASAATTTYYRLPVAGYGYPYGSNFGYGMGSVYEGYGYGYLYGGYPSMYAGMSATSYGPPPPAIRQPIGRREVQTGPNRWESFPIYGDEAVAVPVVPRPAMVPGRAPAYDAPEYGEPAADKAPTTLAPAEEPLPEPMPGTPASPREF